jgi:hypothetical protein
MLISNSLNHEKMRKNESTQNSVLDIFQEISFLGHISTF